MAIIGVFRLFLKQSPKITQFLLALSACDIYKYRRMPSSITPWLRFLEEQTDRRPMSFLCGMRHNVTKGDYCTFHSHRGIEIVYHPTGRGITCTGRRSRVPFEEGSAVIYAPDEPHDQAMETSGEDLCVQVAVSGRKQSIPDKCLYVPVVDKQSVIDDIRLLSLTRTESSPAGRNICNLRATATLLELIQLAEARWRGDEASLAGRHVQKARQYIHEHFPETISLPQIAEYVGVSHDHLRHLFKSLTGISLVRHLNEVRIERAKVLLIHSGLPIKQIATMCGFMDEYYFSAVFRKLNATAPGAYRNKQGAVESLPQHA